MIARAFVWSALLACTLMGCRQERSSAEDSSRTVRTQPPRPQRPAIPMRPAEPEATMSHYEVFRGDALVLDFSPGPGPLISTAPPPPPGSTVPPPHPFLHGAAHDASQEDRLHTLLQASRSVDDFVHRLEAAGYRVQRKP